MTVEILTSRPTRSFFLVLVEFLEYSPILLRCVASSVRHCVILLAIEDDLLLIETIFLPQSVSDQRVFNCSGKRRFIRDSFSTSRFIFGPLIPCILGSGGLVSSDLKVDNHWVQASLALTVQLTTR